MSGVRVPLRPPIYQVLYTVEPDLVPGGGQRGGQRFGAPPTRCGRSGSGNRHRLLRDAPSSVVEHDGVQIIPEDDPRRSVDGWNDEVVGMITPSMAPTGSFDSSHRVVPSAWRV
jgi:hypothetical protein